MAVSEMEDTIIKTELPGLEEKDTDVSLVGDRVVVKGEKRREEAKNGGSASTVRQDITEAFSNH